MTKTRNVSILLILLSVIMCFTACSGGEESGKSNISAGGVSESSNENSSKGIDAFHVKSAKEQKQTTPDSNILVVYFSATGETMRVAQRVAATAQADIFEIQPKIPYKDADLNIHDSDSRANQEMDDPKSRPELKQNSTYYRSYKVIFLGYPIWWEEAPRILSTFVETHDLDGLTVIPFCTSLQSDIGDSAKKLAALTGKGTWLEGKRFSNNSSDKDIKEWTESMLKKLEKPENA